MAATNIFALALFLTLLSLSWLQRNYTTIKTSSSIQGFYDSLRNNDLEMFIFSTNIRVVSRLSRYGLVRRTITKINTERFMNCFANRLNFKLNLVN